MGVYYKYVNHTLHEYVDLSDLREGGDKKNAVLWCGAVLGYLLMPGNGEIKYRHTGQRAAYQGRWHSSDVAEHLAYGRALAPGAVVHVVNVEADWGDWWHDIEPDHNAASAGTGAILYANITQGVLEEMRSFDDDYFDRTISVGRRLCPAYEIQPDHHVQRCIDPYGHRGKHRYGEWVPLTGDELKQYRKRHEGN